MSKFERVQDRIGALSGAIFVLIYFASIILGNPLGGSIQLSPEEHASIFPAVLTRNSGHVDKGIYTALISIFFLFAFVAYLRRQLQLIDRPSGWLPSMAFAGGIAICGIFLLEINTIRATTIVSIMGMIGKLQKRWPSSSGQTGRFKDLPLRPWSLQQGCC
jgi:hypothetical protein